MRVLLIDNYDSFTYNLAQLIATTSGRWPQIRRNDEITVDEINRLAPDCVVLSPGPGHPARARDFGICEDVLQTTALPVLGVCLGHQGIAHCAGAEVVEAPSAIHGLTSRVYHSDSPLFAGIAQGFRAMRYHSLVVQEPLPADLEKIAWTEDGTVMALRHRTKPFWGVQFHPESISSECGDTLLRNFFSLVETNAPTLVYPVNGWRDPEDVYAALFLRDEISFWLDSARTDRYSYIGGSSIPGSYLVEEDEAIARIGSLSAGSARLGFGFHGGFVGYFGYEMKGRWGFSHRHRTNMPGAQFLFTPAVVAFDHQDRSIRLFVAERSSDLLRWASSICNEILSVKPLSLPAAHRSLHLTSADNRGEYVRKIEEAQRQIKRGESYEVCLTTNFRGPGCSDPFAFYRDLRRRSPAPYAAFLKLRDTYICCSSPERFLRIDERGKVSSKPIKGTAPASTDPDDLKNSRKAQSEHLMIVDLLRNDLSRICEPGSVHVPEFMAIESYATVHQMVSTIEGQLPQECSPMDCIAAVFPGGSMTGAPKHRTIEILDELETEPRGIYSGALGYIGLDGCVDLNIVIRTAVMTETETTVGSGGAIIALSDPEEEWAEVQLKARSVSG